MRASGANGRFQAVAVVKSAFIAWQANVATIRKPVLQINSLTSPFSPAACVPRVGTVGVYDKGRRVWRAKTKHQVRLGGRRSHLGLVTSGRLQHVRPLWRRLHCSDVGCTFGLWMS